jgi:hypothetical protein
LALGDLGPDLVAFPLYGRQVPRHGLFSGLFLPKGRCGLVDPLFDLRESRAGFVQAGR